MNRFERRLPMLIAITGFTISSMFFLSLMNGRAVKRTEPWELYTLPKTGTPAQQFINESAILLFPTSLRQVDLLIIVFSPPNNFYLRHAIRRTWGSYTQLDNKTLALRFLLGETNETATQKGIYEEHSRYDDIIQVQFEDIVNNTSIKSLMMLEVVYLHYRDLCQFLLKTIDNVYVNLEPIIGLLLNKTFNFLAGNLQVEELAVKCNKSSCRDVYFPKYLSTSMWLMSMDVAISLFENALKSNYFEQEDVYITGLLPAQNSIARIDHEMFTYVQRKFDPCILARIVISHNLTDEEILMIHRKMVNTNHNKCSNMICSGKIPESKEYVRDDGVICVNPSDLEVLIRPDNFCLPSVNIVILITSASENHARRNAIRGTWGKFDEADNSKMERYFLLGRPINSSESIQDHIITESVMFQDIILVNFQDTYQNLTLKSLLLLKVATTYCSASMYVMKADDDSYINVHRLEKKLKRTNQYDLLVGWLQKKPRRRNSITDKWYVPKSIYKEKVYPNYLSGAGYVMSMDVAVRLYNLSHSHLTYFMEDVFVTGILPKIAGIKPQSMARYFVHYKNELADHPCSYALSVLSHPVNLTDMYVVHDIIKSAEMMNCRRKKA